MKGSLKETINRFLLYSETLPYGHLSNTVALLYTAMFFGLAILPYIFVQKKNIVIAVTY